MRVEDDAASVVSTTPLPRAVTPAAATPGLALESGVDGGNAVSPAKAVAKATVVEAPESVPPEPGSSKARARPRSTSRFSKILDERMMTKAELARRANVSVLTISRIEKGFGCRMDTKRKILEALGLSLADRARVFGEEE